MNKKKIISLLTAVLLMAMGTSVYADEVLEADLESTSEVVEAEATIETEGTEEAEGTVEAEGTEEADVLDEILAKLNTEELGEDATIEDIVNLAVESGLLNEDGVPYTVEELNALVETGEEVVEEGLQNETLERIALARELGITPGKLNLIQKYAKSTGDPESINVEEWLESPVKDIMKAIKINRKATEALEGENTEGEEVAGEETVLEPTELLLEDADATEKVEDSAKKSKKKKSSKRKSKGRGKKK